ncbi:hypothetical protein V6N13_138179 [Hibiscus sabdariffa]
MEVYIFDGGMWLRKEKLSYSWMTGLFLAVVCEFKSAGGVLLPKSAVKFERYLMGEIVSVGTEVGQVEPGKKVLFSDVNAYEVDLGTDARHVFCKESDLLAEVD